MYLLVPRRRLRGLRGLRGFGSDAGLVPGWVNADPSLAPLAAGIDINAPVSTRPAACSWYDYIWPTQACITALAQQQIAEVPANAAAVATYFGKTQPDSIQAMNATAAAQISQNFATQQEAMVPSDVANIEQFYSSGGGVAPFSIPWWVWAAAGGIGLLFVTKALK